HPHRSDTFFDACSRTATSPRPFSRLSFWHHRRLHQSLCLHFTTQRITYMTPYSRYPKRLTPRWSQRRLPLEFMDGLSYTTVIEFAEPPARRRGSALDRSAIKPRNPFGVQSRFLSCGLLFRVEFLRKH